MVDWNWSFLAIDLAVSTTGILAVIMLPRNTGMAFRLATISLTLTSASGLMALSFWTFRSDFDFFWWVPNGFLLVYPLPFLWRLVSSAKV